jgi:hypothetical protein
VSEAPQAFGNPLERAANRYVFGKIIAVVEAARPKIQIEVNRWVDLLIESLKEQIK